MVQSVVGDELGELRVLQSKAETKAYYDKIAGVYDLLAEFSEGPMRQAGLKLLNAVAGETILEIGCGTGHCLVEIARAVGPQGKAIGIDVSRSMLDETEQLLVQERAELHCCDAADLPIDAGTVDGIFVSFTLELFDTREIPNVLREWKRVLKPGGRLVVVAISKEELPGLVSKPFEWTHHHFPNLMDCRPIHVRRALEAVDFEIDTGLIDSMWVPVEIVRGIKRG